LRVAAGEPLPLAQDEIRFRRPCHRGAAVCRRPVRRLHAADRAHRWLAAGGALQSACASTTASPRVARSRPIYDAMVAKLIAHGRDRADALRRLVRALEDAPLLGLRNNGRFLRDLLQHPHFSGSDDDTPRSRRMGRAWRAAAAGAPARAEAWCLAAAVRALRAGTGQRSAAVAPDLRGLGFDNEACACTARRARCVRDGAARLSTAVARRRPAALSHGRRARASACASPTASACTWRSTARNTASRSPRPSRPDDVRPTHARPRAGGRRGGAAARGPGRHACRRPAAGLRGSDEDGDVAARRSPGTVTALHAKAGDQVASGAVLVEIATAD
jgi:acetyl/propionyl-CoA carboxylase alpha subunit